MLAGRKNLVRQIAKKLSAGNPGLGIPAPFPKPNPAGIRKAKKIMAYRSVDEEYAEKLMEIGLSPSAFVLHTELVCRGKMSGLASIPFASLSARLHFTPQILGSALKNLKEKGRVAVDTNHEIIWLIGFIEHQWLAKGRLSDTIRRAILNEYNALPDTPIKQMFREKYPIIFDTVSDTPNDTNEKKSRLKLKVLNDEIVKEESLNKDKDIPAETQKPAGQALPTSKPRSPNQRIQDGEIEAARKEFAKKFGGPDGKGKITDSQICRLAYGARGAPGRSCFESIPVLTVFLRSLKPGDCRDIEDPFAWLVQCARDPETVERAKSEFFKSDDAGRVRTGEPERIGMRALGDVMAGLKSPPTETEGKG